MGNVGRLLDLGLAGLSGGSSAVSVDILGGASVVVLSPHVVVSTDLAGVLLVIVGVGSDGVVRLAPSGVEVAAVGLLGPLVVVVGALGSLVRGGSTLILVGSLAVAGLGVLSTGVLWE